jgi:DNA-binding response OmpR family regulator
MQQVRAATAVLALVSSSSRQIDAIVAALADDSTSVNVYPSLERLLHALPDTGPDVVVLNDDRELDASLQVRLLRRRQPSVFVAFIGVSDETRGIELLQCGADDAITADSPALIARLQAAARRARTVNAGTRIAVGDIVFDREARRVWCAGREVVLTPHEYDVVDCMFWHAPKPVSVDTLADFVWGDQESTNRRTLVQVYMSYVRKKLAKSVMVAIRFSRGSGYAFSPRLDQDTIELAKREG